jgi:hypothetical protein
MLISSLFELLIIIYHIRWWHQATCDNRRKRTSLRHLVGKADDVHEGFDIYGGWKIYEQGGRILWVHTITYHIPARGSLDRSRERSARRRL